MVRRRALIIALALAPCAAGRAADVGRDFGESLSVLASARQVGTGGVALEDPWRQGSLVEATTIVLTSGMQWVGFGTQGGAGPALRLAFDGFSFTPSSFTRTIQLPDGGYGGEGGSVGASEWGARITALYTLLDGPPLKVAAIGRTFGIVQRLPDASHVGIAAEAGAQARWAVGVDRALTGWILGGPLGEGAGRPFASQATFGAGYLAQVDHGLVGGPGGYGTGMEGQYLSSGLPQVGLGFLTWVGRPGMTDLTFSLRLGLRYAAGSAAVIQPRAGLGVLWRLPTGLALQFDYAVVPIGELGWYHYVTLGVRLPQTASAGHG